MKEWFAEAFLVSNHSQGQPNIKRINIIVRVKEGYNTTWSLSVIQSM